MDNSDPASITRKVCLVLIPSNINPPAFINGVGDSFKTI